MKYEVTVTEKQLAAIWANTGWNNPFENYLNESDTMWDFLFETGRCPYVLKNEYPSISVSNDDANEILNAMSRSTCYSLIDSYIEKHEEIRGAFNNWWWSNHDGEDYEEEEQ